MHIDGSRYYLLARDHDHGAGLFTLNQRAASYATVGEAERAGDEHFGETEYLVVRIVSHAHTEPSLMWVRS